MTKKKPYEKPRLIQLHKSDSACGADCTGTGSFAEPNCSSNGSIANQVCYSNGSVAGNTCDYGGSP